jgi:serine/threonine protein phosphatase PrpC/cold shock CspA family protein
LYLHIKSGIYYVQKDGDPKAFRKIEDDDDPVIRKMKQSEEMRKAIQSTEFVQFGDGSGEKAPMPSNADEPPSAPPPTNNSSRSSVPPGFQEVPPEPEKPKEVPKDDKMEGKVREWNSEKGFGFIVPLAAGTKDDEASKGVFVHLWNVVGSSHSNPINLREGARVQYKLGEQDGKSRAMDVVMLGKDGKPLPIHAGSQTLEEKRKSFYVTANALGVRFHAESWPGKQMELRDRYTADEPMEELGVYFAAFDGHGGTQVSDHLSKTLHKNILQFFRAKQVQPASRDEKIKAAVKEAFVHSDKELVATAERKKFEQSGSTALVAILHGNPKLNTPLKLVIAHCGNSRAVLCRAGQAVALTEDHTPERLDEKKRVEQAGGLVLNVRGAWRIAAPANPNAMTKASRREYQGLAMTRSFGDLHFKQPIMLSNPEPDVKILPITDKDLFVVLCTDGIFTHLSNQEVVDLASNHWSDPEEASKKIVRTAFQKGSDDNLTAVVIQFGWADKTAPACIDKRRAISARGLEGGSPKLKASSAALVDTTAVDDGFDMFG